MEPRSNLLPAAIMARPSAWPVLLLAALSIAAIPLAALLG